MGNIIRTIKGSVKLVDVYEEPTAEKQGLCRFRFTDDYSVFDYGKMPDTIPAKGESLCRGSAWNFEQLSKLGVKNHFRKMVSGTEMEVNMVRILYPQKNEITSESTNFLVPLEVMFRNYLPAGSSMLKRIQKGEIDYHALGFEEMPEPGAKIPKPKVDFSTKLEELTDRYLSDKEAQEMAKMSDDEFEEMKKIAMKINDFLTEQAERIGLLHADGKVEFAFGPERELILVDVVGTLDEGRFLFDGAHLSKQVLRDYYKAAHPEWCKKVNELKDKGIGREQWPKPEKVPQGLIEIVSNMYKSVCEAWTGDKVWNAPSLPEVVQAYRNFLEKSK